MNRQFDRSCSAGLTMFAHARSRPGHVGHTTFPQLFSFPFSLDSRLTSPPSVYTASRLHHAETRARNRCPSRARCASIPNSHPNSLTECSSFSSAQPLVWSARSPSLTFCNVSFSKPAASPEDLSCSRSGASQRHFPRLLDSGAPRQPSRPHRGIANGINSNLQIVYGNDSSRHSLRLAHAA